LLQPLHLQVGVLLFLSAFLCCITSSFSCCCFGLVEIVGVAVSNAASSLLKRLWSLKSTTKTGILHPTLAPLCSPQHVAHLIPPPFPAAVSGHRPLMKFESGYTVETVFDGSKLGIEPHSVEVTQSGELLLLDSVNSNLYRISLPLSRYSRPKLIAGSPEGYVGHVDGRPREARMNHPKGLTVDGRGNIYVADTMNMAIRKISDTGKSESMKEIHLNFDDCAHQYEAGLPLDEGLFCSIGKLVSGTWSSTAAIFGAVFPVFRKKPKAVQYQQQQRVNVWPVPESFVIPDDEIPPPLETRAPTPHKTYAFMSKEPEKIHHIRHAPPYVSGWGAEAQQQQQQVHQRQHLRQHRHYSSGPQTYYEQSCETTNEIVFGAVQESDSKRRSVEIKAVNYGDPIYEQYGMRYRSGYSGYGNY
ncbi:hypothetical protein GW17_00054335, partial [Ensete ventricosum]